MRKLLVIFNLLLILPMGALAASQYEVAPDRPARKLGSSPLDQCLKKKLDALIKKEAATSPEPSDPLAKALSEISKELLLKGEISVETLDPSMVEECQKKMQEKIIASEKVKEEEREISWILGIPTRLDRSISRASEAVWRVGKSMWTISIKMTENFHTNFDRSLLSTGQAIQRVSEAVQNALDPVNWFKSKSKNSSH